MSSAGAGVPPATRDALANLMRSRPAASAAYRSTEAREVVVTVHGTYANPGFPEMPGRNPGHWWDAPSPFSDALDLALARHGSTATCSLPMTARLDDDRRAYFRGWSGANSELERRQGAYRLAQYLHWLQERDDVSTIHVIAHSHGGNVVRRAFRYLAAPARKRGVVVCLGTPFLHFSDQAAWRRWAARVNWPMAGVLGGCGWGLAIVVRQPAPDYWQLYLLTAVATGALVALGRYARQAVSSRDDGRVVSIRFARDEAIQLLRGCAALIEAPHLYLRDLLGGPAPRRQVPDLGRRRARFLTVWDRVSDVASRAWGRLASGAFAVSNAWNGPVCRGVERAASVLPLGALPLSLVLILCFRPYRPPLRPFLLSRMPRLDTLFFHAVNEEMERSVDEALRPRTASSPMSELGSPFKGSLLDPQLALTMAGALSAGLYYIVYPLDLLLGLPVWLSAVATRFAILVGVRAAAGTAAGMDMLGSAYRARSTGTIPSSGVEDVVVPADIEADIERRVAQLHVGLTDLRSALDPARRATLAQALRAAFADVDLLHAQYYQDPRIIDYVAQRIARVHEPQWYAEETGERR